MPFTITNSTISAASTIVDVLRIRASAKPDDLAFSFLIDGEAEGPQVTYCGLHAQASAIAVALTDRTRLGDRALLLYAPGLEFIGAFFGCLYAGVVPVPVFPPRLDRLAQTWESLANVTKDCEPAILMTTRDLIAFLPDPAVIGRAVSVVCTDAFDTTLAAQWCERQIDPESLALIQYTSGSTASPKGVMVTHKNLMNNQRVMESHTGPAGPGLGVCWVPLYHENVTHVFLAPTITRSACHLAGNSA